MALTLTQKEPSQSRLVQTDQAGHWYTQEGESAHVVIGKNGNERNTTVTDARKMGLLPSVTSVLGIMDKPQLTAWKITLPKEDGETLEEYAKRVVKDSKQSTTKAAEHGTKMHECMENILLGRAVSRDETLAPYIKTFKEWAEDNVEKTYWCERALVGAGYAGRCDAYVRLKRIGDAIIDLKNRKVNPKYDPFYDSDCAQLWAYRIASENPKAACVSVVLAANDPETLVIHQWSEEELHEAGIAFQAMLKVWAWSKR
ncbi:MAG: hypothetical protein EBR82_71580 [Caulobacteraceae bacterium]|nr:hypothetical protein [Caulobacteraceae bacterium]